MKYREIGKSGISASVIGFGGWAIGGDSWWGPTDDANSVKALETAIDNGITLIDTAPGYGFGRSERVVGQAIKGKRDKLVISTKCGLIWWANKGSFYFEHMGERIMICLEPETIVQEVENSLKNLGTDYIDILHTHWQAIEPWKTPIEVTMECLLKLKDQGKIRAIGVSNCNADQMKEYMAVGRIDVNQAKYSMLDRNVESTIQDYCIENNMSIMAYSPLEQGLLTGKITMDFQPLSGTYRNVIPWYKPDNRIKVLRMLEGWKDLTEKYCITLPQLVIAWTYSQPGLTHILCGARRPEQVLENVKAGDVQLEDADIKRMRADVEALGAPQL